MRAIIQAMYIYVRYLCVYLCEKAARQQYKTVANLQVYISNKVPSSLWNAPLTVDIYSTFVVLLTNKILAHLPPSFSHIFFVVSNKICTRYQSVILEVKAHAQLNCMTLRVQSHLLKTFIK